MKINMDLNNAFFMGDKAGDRLAFVLSEMAEAVKGRSRNHVSLALDGVAFKGPDGEILIHIEVVG